MKRLSKELEIQFEAAKQEVELRKQLEKLLDLKKLAQGEVSKDIEGEDEESKQTAEQKDVEDDNDNLVSQVEDVGESDDDKKS